MSVKRLQNTLTFIGLAGGVFYFDQWTKKIFSNKSAQELIPFWLSTTQHQNHGLLANIPVPMPIIILLTGIICMFLLFETSKEIKREKSRTMIYAFAFIFGGAIGNIFDRLIHGYVFDWILIFSRSIINIADIAIGFGICLWVSKTYLTKTIINESDI
ncbi:signal peptidase II [Candidatus Uhrbacteria bacterium]|nr:signal peptidase II [Candidatus Uhrbacteria bacterium]